MSDGRESTREEVELLHLFGFHEVKGLEGSWQWGRAIPGHLDEPKGPYTLEEALEIVKKEKGDIDATN